jgi:hypothetical protein
MPPSPGLPLQYRSIHPLSIRLPANPVSPSSLGSSCIHLICYELPSRFPIFISFPSLEFRSHLLLSIVVDRSSRAFVHLFDCCAVLSSPSAYLIVWLLYAVPHPSLLITYDCPSFVPVSIMPVLDLSSACPCTGLLPHHPMTSPHDLTELHNVSCHLRPVLIYAPRVGRFRESWHTWWFVMLAIVTVPCRTIIMPHGLFEQPDCRPGRRTSTSRAQPSLRDTSWFMRLEI